jgi:prevent-host-death family protein
VRLLRTPDEPAARGESRAREVTVTDLRRGTAALVDRVRGGEIAVITKHGRPLAMVLGLADGERLLPVEVTESDVAKLAAFLERREFLRRLSELYHGRWCDGHGIHGPYRRRRPASRR